jgi:hypothetical protein
MDFERTFLKRRASHQQWVYAFYGALPVYRCRALNRSDGLGSWILQEYQTWGIMAITDVQWRYRAENQKNGCPRIAANGSHRRLAKTLRLLFL